MTTAAGTAGSDTADTADTAETADTAGTAAVAAVLHDHIVTAHAPDTGTIPSDYDLIDGGVLDSLALVSLLAWIGSRFELPIEELDLDPRRLRSIAALADFVVANRHASFVSEDH